MGAVRVNVWVVVAAVLVGAYLMGFIHIPQFGSEDALSVATGVPQARVAISDLSAGNEKAVSEGSYVVTLTSSDLNAENITALSFDINLERVDTIPDVNNAYPIFKIKCSGAEKKEVDGVDYYTVQYIENEEVYNFTIGGSSAEVSNKYGVNVALAQGTGASKEVVVSIPSTADLNNFAENIGETQDLLTCKVYNNAGQEQGSITLRYVRTA